MLYITICKALLSCPASSIHTERPPRDILEVQKTFPIPINEERLPVGLYNSYSCVCLMFICSTKFWNIFKCMIFNWHFIDVTISKDECWREKEPTTLTNLYMIFRSFFLARFIRNNESFFLLRNVELSTAKQSCQHRVITLARLFKMYTTPNSQDVSQREDASGCLFC